MPCDNNGNNLPPHWPPPNSNQATDNKPEWYLFTPHLELDFALHHFIEIESSECTVNKRLDLWAASVIQFPKVSYSNVFCDYFVNTWSCSPTETS